mgnify:CR=1 FL=1
MQEKNVLFYTARCKSYCSNVAILICGDYAVAAPFKMPSNKNPPALVKKIGRTTYIVRIHFSKTSTETMSDKIKRMLKNEIQQM